MSRYETSRVMWEITRDRELADRFRTDPALVLDKRDLDEPERAALADRDIRSLFRLGVHPFVLYHFALRLEGGSSMPFMKEYVGKLEGLTVGDLET